MDRPARVVAEEEQDMTDRELLELAAKAAGLTILSWPQEDYAVVQNGDQQCGWSPLAFDSDALRLAVKLKMTMDVTDKASGAGAIGLKWCSEPCKDDPYAATRRAIVRAAAEIGRSKT
jgi:hypothetical protein